VISLNAEIIKINDLQGTAIFLRDDVEYGWLEILGATELECNEIIYGNFQKLGGTTIKTETGENVDVFIHDFCSLEVATEMVFG